MTSAWPDNIIDLMQSMEIGDDRERVVGSSPAFVNMLRQIADAVLDGDAPVLILGEDGTGKEMAARLLHQLGPRGTRPFACFTISAWPDSLQQGVLFGSDRPSCAGPKWYGKFDRADDGTLFADCITAMVPSLQGEFLQTIHDGGYSRPDGTTRSFRGRVMFSANADALSSAMNSGLFSPSLYDWMTSGPVIRVPPLRERGNDVMLIADYALPRFTRLFRQTSPRRFSEEARAFLRARTYPGNVRQLMNIVEAAVAANTQDEVSPAALGRAAGPDASTAPI